VTPDYQADGVTLYHGDCRAVLPTLPGASFDLVFTDPPYPEIDRPYGRLTEAEWFDLMRAVVPEARRVLKAKGSAVFVLQPNSERAGKLRPWLFEFQAWLCREWNVVQDAWWWNYTALPGGAAIKGKGLLRGSVKACVWAGAPDCHRDQDAVLWGESEANAVMRRAQRAERHSKGHHRVAMVNNHRMGHAALARGGVTPFNLIPLGGAQRWEDGGVYGHTGTTPLTLCDWWCRYLVPPGGAVLDPFCGSGTTGVAALRQGKTFVGIEKETAYVTVARKRLSEVHGPLFAPREVAAGG
jgi:16S rRNA G966 N2-methylase RsmD